MSDCPPRFIKSRQMVKREQTDTDGYSVVTSQACMSVKIRKLD